MTSIPRRAALMAATCLALAAPALAQAQEAPLPRITVTGEGEVAAAPDMATVSLGITAENAEAGAAMDEASRVAESLLARLDELGIAAADRQSSDISLRPVWSNGEDGTTRGITGYEAGNMLTVRVRDLDRIGEVLGAVLDGGANQLSGLSFGLQEPKPVMQDARRAAVADAMDKARVLAEAAGVTLGPVISIAEAGGGFAPAPMMEMARGAKVPVAAGETVVSTQVTMVFELGGAPE
ncbi:MULTISPECIES: SIMPL domain-containing protein [unclassified Salipiger]|uniref:SIMPL domain-containing protein n=1 Tax=unclassified Salipiger TaxID=2640570 RepID=UPI0013BC649E|nr:MULTISPECIES: SIMPL domain-containing protein [unclassified Salipiger]NDV48195.1 SIMPL domain-containing protein [Salipiger sp. PrR003]NDW35423.1 SIMPL domain-containing protein [Salipiger sp. PrR007]